MNAIERGQSVLVSAHTSAGKTAVAEYAIATCLRDKQRVIYTSPIKALSNQKFRELAQEFTDVGLMTGDVTQNPNASCLVMTTEILRSMLYRGSEILREVAWVIFDEVHYMRDKERGVVWEETMILLPDAVRFVFLSATIPNALEFAQWIAKLHNQPVHVVYTDYRPTPLQHYMFPTGSDGLYLVVDEQGRFREQNFQKAISLLNNSKKLRGNSKLDMTKILRLLLERQFQPVIVFSFSKRDCENHALHLSRMDFNSQTEKQQIAEVFKNAISTLSEEDKQLPQVLEILPLLKRGIGVHHSGLLPLIKEVIEVLFQEGLIKVLFSTETFSMGLNMPAKTVVFTSIRKFDGETFRWIRSGEYIQMSGRAGRRGLDERGVVVMMIEESMDPTVAKTMMSGKADPLMSSFHLSYNMILNLLRLETIHPDYLMSRSFLQFQTDCERPALEAALKERQKELEEHRETLCPKECLEYYALRKRLAVLRESMRQVILSSPHLRKFLVPGRLVRLLPMARKDGTGSGTLLMYGVLLSFSNGTATILQENETMLVSVPLEAVVDAVSSIRIFVNPQIQSGGSAAADGPTAAAESSATDAPSTFESSTSQGENRKKAVARLQEVVYRRFPQGVPLLDPAKDLHVSFGPRDGAEDGGSTMSLVQEMTMLEKSLAVCLSSLSVPAGGSRALVETEAIERGERLDALEQQAKDLQSQLDRLNRVILRQELKSMKRVLRRLKFTNENNIVQLKGMVACELNATTGTDGLLLVTELLFHGILSRDSVTPNVVAALFSVFVCDEKAPTSSSSSSSSSAAAAGNPTRTPKGRLGAAESAGGKVDGALEETLLVLGDIRKRVREVSVESGLVPPVGTSNASSATKGTLATGNKAATASGGGEKQAEDGELVVNREMVYLVYEWARGVKFAELCQMTDMFEGSIIRVMRRLEELLRQCGCAAKAMGDMGLLEKFTRAGELLKRDIVFAASLYV